MTTTSNQGPLSHLVDRLEVRRSEPCYQVLVDFTIKRIKEEPTVDKDSEEQAFKVLTDNGLLPPAYHSRLVYAIWWSSSPYPEIVGQYLTKSHNFDLDSVYRSGSLEAAQYVITKYRSGDIRVQSSVTLKNWIAQACRSGSRPLVEYLLKPHSEGLVDLGTIDTEDLNHFIYKACKSGSLDLFQYLEGYRDFIPLVEDTEILAAYRSGSVRLLQYLTKITSSDFRPNDRQSLIEAIKSGSLEMVRYLVETYSDLGVEEVDQGTLKAAIKAHTYLKEDSTLDSLEVVKYLFSRLASNPFASVHDLVMYSLETAVKYGSLEVIQYLIAETDLDLLLGWILIDAVIARQEAIFIYLIKSRPEVLNQCDRLLETILHQVVRCGTLKMVLLLLEHRPQLLELMQVSILRDAIHDGTADVLAYLLERPEVRGLLTPYLRDQLLKRSSYQVESWNRVISSLTSASGPN